MDRTGRESERRILEVRLLRAVADWHEQQVLDVWTKHAIPLDNRLHMPAKISCQRWINIVSTKVRKFIHSVYRQQLLPVNTGQSLKQQCVALTGRNTTGPPCSRRAIIRLEAAWRHRYRRRQTPATVTSSPYIMYRRASNKRWWMSNGGRQL